MRKSRTKNRKVSTINWKIKNLQRERREIEELRIEK